MSMFVREPDGGVAMVLDVEESILLAQLAEQLTSVLTDASAVGIAGARMQDPAIARLLPDGYQDDEEAAADFRRFTSEGLLSGKVASALSVRSALVSGAGVGDDGELVAGDIPDEELSIRLDDETAWTWLRFLTDVRLTLAARLGIEDEDEDDSDDPDGPLGSYPAGAQDDDASDEDDEEYDDDSDDFRSRLTEPQNEPLMMAVYGWLGYLQESIVIAIDEPRDA